MYVVERQSAEGLFFHRSCFRCTVCKCRLLLGNYAYHCEDEDENGKFYCKIHYNSIIYKGNKEEESPHQQILKKAENNSGSMLLYFVSPVITLNPINFVPRKNCSPPRKFISAKYFKIAWSSGGAFGNVWWKEKDLWAIGIYLQKLWTSFIMHFPFIYLYIYIYIFNIFNFYLLIFIVSFIFI